MLINIWFYFNFLLSILGQSCKISTMHLLKGELEALALDVLSPTRPSGPSWSSSHRVCVSVCLSVPFSCVFFRGLSLVLRLALSSRPPRRARPSAIS